MRERAGSDMRKREYKEEEEGEEQGIAEVS